MNIMVTGGKGFLGKYLIAALEKSGHKVFEPIIHNGLDGDLTYSDTFRLWAETWSDKGDSPPRIDVLIHAAGRNGGILYNREKPATIFSQNTQMALNVLEFAREYRVKKFIGVVAACAYPDTSSGPAMGVCFEDNFLKGVPHPSVECHGRAKQALQYACLAYKQEFGLDAICVCPAHLYGPGMPFTGDKTKFLSGLIHKIGRAILGGEKEVRLLGDGTPLREVVHVRDVADAIVHLSENHDIWQHSDKPLNIPGYELSLHEWAYTVRDVIARATGKHDDQLPAILWGDPADNGQRRKTLSATYYRQFVPCLHSSNHYPTSGLRLMAGLEETWNDYVDRFYSEEA